MKTSLGFAWKKIRAIKRVENGEKLFNNAASCDVSNNIVADWHQNKTKL